MSRHRLIILGLVLATLSGCLYVPYAFPTITYRPLMTLDAEADQVLVLHATRKYQWEAVFLSIGPQESFELHQCQLVEHSQTTLDQELSLGLGYGLAGVLCHPMGLFLPMPSFTIYKSEPVIILYRPGFQPQKLLGWTSERQVSWKRAATLEEERAAFNDCFGVMCNRIISIDKLTLEEATVYHEFIRKERERLGLLNTLGASP